MVWPIGPEWDELADESNPGIASLPASVCPSCDHIIYPAIQDCPECNTETLGGEGFVLRIDVGLADQIKGLIESGTEEHVYLPASPVQ